MLTRVLGILFIASWAVASTQADAQPGPNSRYIVFIHYGGGSPDNAQRVALALAKLGYVVRKPDNQRDIVGGPGVDYFYSQDA